MEDRAADRRFDERIERHDHDRGKILRRDHYRRNRGGHGLELRHTGGDHRRSDLANGDNRHTHRSFGSDGHTNEWDSPGTKWWELDLELALESFGM